MTMADRPYKNAHLVSILKWRSLYVNAYGDTIRVFDYVYHIPSTVTTRPLVCAKEQVPVSLSVYAENKTKFSSQIFE
jgi:hypothetical protein